MKKLQLKSSWNWWKQLEVNAHNEQKEENKNNDTRGIPKYSPSRLKAYALFANYNTRRQDGLIIFDDPTVGTILTSLTNQLQTTTFIWTVSSQQGVNAHNHLMFSLTD